MDIAFKLFMLCSFLLVDSASSFSVHPSWSSKSYLKRQQHIRTRISMSTTTAAPTTGHKNETIARSESFSDEVLDRVLEVAIDASKKAGEIILGNAGGAEVTERKSNSRDLLTLIDPLCEKVRALLL